MNRKTFVKYLYQGYLKVNKRVYNFQDTATSGAQSQNIKNPPFQGRYLNFSSFLKNALLSCFDIIKKQQLLCISKVIICSILKIMCQFSPSVHD